VKYNTAAAANVENRVGIGGKSQAISRQ